MLWWAGKLFGEELGGCSAQPGSLQRRFPGTECPAQRLHFHLHSGDQVWMHTLTYSDVSI